MRADRSDPSVSLSLPPSTGDNETYTRLHITPFDPELLKIVLPNSIAHAARNVSFHSIETFPEKRYGFVDLPHMEAEKLKKKLNGATLKGTKVRIEKARPERRDQPDDTVPGVEEAETKKSTDGSKERKKRKREIDVLEGVKLQDRKVKRGWTETPEEANKKSKRTKGSKDKEKSKDGDKKLQRKRVKSKYTDEAECLLNTKVPPNALKNLTASESASKKRKKDKSRQVTIHEFEKTTKFPSFLKSTGPTDGAAVAVDFVEGKGWIDAEGKVVETVKPKVKPAKKQKAQATAPSLILPEHDSSSSEDTDDTSSSGTSSEDDDSSDGAEEANSPPAPSPTIPAQSTPTGLSNSDKARPMSSSSSRSLTIKIPPPITPSSTKVHPLEALYKRAKPEDAVTETPAQEQPFSFFDGGDDDEDVPATSQPAIPMTPFTRQDLEWRNVRSAAPTPDTAHPSRVRNFWANSNDEEQPSISQVATHDDAEDVGEEEEDDEPTGPAAGTSQDQKSEFQDWFWENRRELNKSWMKRRKVSAKEKRHRDNKARASRVF
ncbi:hypothetical protein NLU13_8799 [Sarocladium strictum]|uniref:Uncharacterized protein n=1 Tax=Sarocladium strictum TaxID=5046 RepID=A0AA39G8Y8_SARSR|nr:hypothetical protein NLU13_8799 [Sarocladium strictum]